MCDSGEPVETVAISSSQGAPGPQEPHLHRPPERKATPQASLGIYIDVTGCSTQFMQTYVHTFIHVYTYLGCRR